MAKQLFLNNFESNFINAVLATPVTGTPATELGYGILRINASAASVLITPGSDYYLLTALKRAGSVESALEVMKVIYVDNTTVGECRITVLRGLEGTTPQAYLSGDFIALRWTAASAANVLQGADNLAGIASAATARTNLGLGNLDNTSDANKPVSTAQATAIGLKETATNKDATGGYAGLTLLKINFKNAANTFISWLTNSNTAARTYTFQDRDGTIADGTDLALKQNTSARDASGGYAGLTAFKLNMLNVAGTFISFFTNSNTAARTYTLPDAAGTIALTSDITGTNSGTNTGDNAANTTYASDYRVANFVAGAQYVAPSGKVANVAGGLGGQIPYQTALDTTAFIANGTAGYILQANGTTVAPSWVLSTTLTAGNSNQLLSATWVAPGAIGSTTPNTGAFTTLSANSLVSGAGFSSYLAAPPAIGGSTPAAGTFTLATANSFVPNSATVPTNGMYYPTANTLGWATNGVNRLNLNATGDLTATGNVSAYSDERLKTNWRDLSENFVERLAEVKSGIYDRTDQSATQVGVSAQSLQRVLPYAVLEDEDGMLSVAYGNAALIACVMLAREVQALKATLADVRAAL